MRRSLIPAAVLLGAAPCLAGSISTDRLWSVAVHDDVDGQLFVDGTLYVRRTPEGHRFRLECLISGPAAGTDSRTSVWGAALVKDDVVIGRIEGGEEVLQLPGRMFTLRLAADGGTWTSNVPGCPQAVRIAGSVSVRNSIACRWQGRRAALGLLCDFLADDGQLV